MHASLHVDTTVNRVDFFALSRLLVVHELEGAEPFMKNAPVFGPFPQRPQDISAKPVMTRHFRAVNTHHFI